MQRVRTVAVAVVLVGLTLSFGVGVTAGASPVGSQVVATAGGPPMSVRSTATASRSPTAPRSVSRRDEANISVFVAPGSDLSTMQDAESIVEYGNVTLTRRPHVTLSDTLVVQVHAPGLETAVNQQPGNGTTEKFFSLVQRDRVSVTGSEAYVPANETRQVFSLANRNTTSVVEAGDRTYQLVVNLSAVRTTLDENGNGRPDEGQTQPISSGDVYRLHFSFDDYSENESILVFPVAVEFAPSQDGNSPVLYPKPDQRIRGTTTLAPGTKLRIQLTGTGTEPFRRTKTVRVTGADQPMFSASFDLVDIEDGQPLIVLVKDGDRNIGKAEGRIPKLNASLTVPDRIDSTDHITVPRVTFSQGGFLVVRSGGSDGPIVGNRYLAPGTYTGLRVQFAQPVKADTLSVSAYVDIDGDRIFDRGGLDRPFRRDGTPVSHVVDVSGVTGTPAITTRPPPSPSTPTEPTTSVETTPLVTPPGSTTTERPTAPTPTGPSSPATFTPYTITANGPGFTAGVALAALLALVGLLAWRRT